MSITEAKAAAERIVKADAKDGTVVTWADFVTVARALLALTSGTDEESAREIVSEIKCVEPGSEQWTRHIGRIAAALAAARAEERERACKVICQYCADEMPVTLSKLGVFHTKPGYWGEWECRASAIRGRDNG